MPLLARFASVLKQRWLRLSTYSGSRRLSWFSLVLLFGLDMYVLGLAFQGMDQVSGSIAYPQSRISSGCASLTEDYLKLESDARIERLGGLVLRSLDDTRPRVFAVGFAEVETLPLCGEVRDLLQSYEGNAELTTLYETLAQRQQEIYALRREMEELKASYDSALLEKVAGQKREDSILPVEATRIKRVLAGKTAQAAALEDQQGRTRQALVKHPLVQAYGAKVRALPVEEVFKAARDELASQEFWYPLKTFLARLAFVLPLMLLALIWNRHALNRGQDIPTLISSHLILVCALPIFVEMVKFIYWLLPHRLLANLMAMLEALNLGFLWNYVAILGGILGGIGLIYLAQKTLFSPARQRGQRLRKGLCCDCGEPLHSTGQTHCEFCGAAQLAVCPQCGQSHRKLAFHCGFCGVALS